MYQFSKKEIARLQEQAQVMEVSLLLNEEVPYPEVVRDEDRDWATKTVAKRHPWVPTQILYDPAYAGAWAPRDMGGEGIALLAPKEFAHLAGFYPQGVW